MDLELGLAFHFIKWGWCESHDKACCMLSISYFLLFFSPLDESIAGLGALRIVAGGVTTIHVANEVSIILSTLLFAMFRVASLLYL